MLPNIGTLSVFGNHQTRLNRIDFCGGCFVLVNEDFLYEDQRFRWFIGG
jgi:hypothetical protein